MKPRITIEDELWRKVRAKAFTEGLTASQVVTTALNNYVAPTTYNVGAYAGYVSSDSYTTLPVQTSTTEAVYRPAPKPVSKRKARPNFTANVKEDEVAGW